MRSYLVKYRVVIRSCGAPDLQNRDAYRHRHVGVRDRPHLRRLDSCGLRSRLVRRRRHRQVDLGCRVCVTRSRHRR